MINNLMIAVPTLDYMHRKFVESLTDLSIALSDCGVYHNVCYEGATLVYISRDNLVKRAMSEQFDWVLWLDADMVFKPDIINHLIIAKKDFITGVFRGRHGGTKIALYDSLFPPKRWDDSRYWNAMDLEKIAGCGFGCVLIKTDILKEVMLEYGTCFTPTPQLGEDLAFCKRATDLGYDIWTSRNAEVGHIGQCFVNVAGEKEMI